MKPEDSEAIRDLLESVQTPMFREAMESAKRWRPSADVVSEIAEQAWQGAKLELARPMADDERALLLHELIAECGSPMPKRLRRRRRKGGS